MNESPKPGAATGLNLDVRDLRIAFTDPGGAIRTVLEVPAFSIPGAKQFALCGPSGSGKSTFLDILAGLQRPQHGRVRWAGVDLTALGEPALDRWRRGTVGIVFQQFHLFHGLSALENVVLPLRFARWSITPEMRRSALDLLERVGVQPTRHPATMSRGEMQRVAVARALLQRPPIVLADEPTASLDRDTGRIIADLLCTLCREAAATLVVATHDFALAENMDEAYDIAAHGLRPRTARAPVLSIASAT